MQKFIIPSFNLGRYQSNLYYCEQFPNGIPPNEYEKLKRQTCDPRNKHYYFAYYRTIKGCIELAYSNQKLSCKGKQKQLPEYDIEWMFNYIKQHLRFKTVFVDWIESGFEIKCKPSIARIDYKSGYIKSNIELMSWKEHKAKIAEYRKYGNFATSQKTAVQMLDLDGNFIENFLSVGQAERWLRKNGFPKATQSNICNCCQGRYKKAYKHKWIYKNAQ